MAREQERAAAVGEAMARVRALESEHSVTRHGLAAIKEVLQSLARRSELFGLDDFPPPAPGGVKNNQLYCLSEDADHRFALYLQSSLPGVDVPPHNHTTWAVIVGLEGIEENRFYDRSQAGAVETGKLEVGPGVGVAFLPEEVHSIHIHGDRPVLNFHLYGLALDRLTEREYWSEKDQAWRVMSLHEGIIDRRAP